MFSYTRIILEDTEQKIYERGLDYANRNKVKLIDILNNGCSAVVSGTKKYDVHLGFSRVGSPKYSCACEYFSSYNSDKITCKHIIGTALAWDRSRNVPDPDQETIKQLCIPEPDFTQKDINKAYKDPLNANLEILRADPTGWMRPHARLPKKPKICLSNNCNFKTIRKGLSELKAWTRKYNYDYYFCAGEMIAGFCELLHWVKKNLQKNNSEDQIKFLELLTNFNHELIMERIDDSDGLHIFSETHLYNLINLITVENLTSPQKKKLQAIKRKIQDY